MYPRLNWKIGTNWRPRWTTVIRRHKKMLGKIPAKSNSAVANNELRKKWNFAKKDPNTMDIDSMTTEQ